MRETIESTATTQRRVWLGTDKEIIINDCMYSNGFFVEAIFEYLTETTSHGATMTTYSVKATGPIRTSKGNRHRSQQDKRLWMSSRENVVMSEVPEEIRQHLIGMDALRERVAR